MEFLKPEFISDDGRRILKQLFTAPIAQVNVYEAKKGAILGNHFHKDTIEYFYVIKGTILYNEHTMFYRGDLFKVSPPEHHTIEIVSSEASFMTFLTKPYDQKEPDVWEKSLLQEVVDLLPRIS